MAEDKDEKKKAKKKKRSKKAAKDKELDHLLEFAQTVKYSLDTQMCDINRNRKSNNQIFKPRLLCAKQLMSQNKNVIVSITGPNTPNAKDCCYAPIIYEQGSDDNSETHNPLKKQKFLLSNSDIPYIE